MPDKMNPRNDYETFFSMSLDMLCIAKTNGYFKKINPSFSRNLGYDHEYLMSKSFLDFVHPVDFDMTLAEIEKLKSGQHTTSFVNRYKHAEGGYRHLSWSARMDAESGLLFSVARDVTNEQTASTTLKQIQHALNEKTIVALTDRKGTIVEVNDKFCEISGYSRKELIGQNHRILSSGKHPKEFFQDLWKTISSGQSWSNMIENKSKKGEPYFVQSIITPIYGVDGEITNYLAIRFDVTKHVHIKKELERTLSILNETGKIAKIGGWELEIETGALTWTDGTFNILEVEKPDGRSPYLPEGLELFTPESKPIVEQALQRAIDYGEDYSLVVEALTAKGNKKWVYTNGKANSVDGKIVSLSGTIQDIHDRKIAEEKFQVEYQKNIHNAKLTSLGELAAGVAHEINNPLSIISGSASLMQSYSENSERTLEKVEDILSSCDRIARIVKSLKKFSRSNEKPEQKEQCLLEIANEALLLTEVKSKRHSVEVRILPNSTTQILCDEIEIEQVLVNLINNAIDAIKNLDEKWITINFDATDKFVVMTVQDSGERISKDIERKLFDPFFTTKRNGEGTGLGLSITKGILDQHNAEIALDHTSKNTSFVVKFPHAMGQ